MTTVGGISAHLGDTPDLFHTHFAVAALGLHHPLDNLRAVSDDPNQEDNHTHNVVTHRVPHEMGSTLELNEKAVTINPIFCLPTNIVDFILHDSASASLV